MDGVHAGEARAVGRGLALAEVRRAPGLEALARREDPAVMLAAHPRRPPAANEAAAGHGGEVIDGLQHAELVEALQEAERDGGAADAAARERDAHVRIADVVGLSVANVTLGPAGGDLGALRREPAVAGGGNVLLAPAEGLEQRFDGREHAGRWSARRTPHSRRRQVSEF